MCQLQSGDEVPVYSVLVSVQSQVSSCPQFGDKVHRFSMLVGLSSRLGGNSPPPRALATTSALFDKSRPQMKTSFVSCVDSSPATACKCLHCLSPCNPKTCRASSSATRRKGFQCTSVCHLDSVGTCHRRGRWQLLIATARRLNLHCECGHRAYLERLLVFQTLLVRTG